MHGLRRWIGQSFLACLAVAPCFASGGTRILGDPSGTVYATVQAALDAAPDGATLLVPQGQYQPFAIDGKSTTIVGFPGAMVEVHGTIDVRNLQEDSSVVLIGLRASAVGTSNSANSSALEIANCAGLFRAQGCTFTGPTG